jgi:hypothetical protein
MASVLELPVLVEVSAPLAPPVDELLPLAPVAPPVELLPALLPAPVLPAPVLPAPLLPPTEPVPVEPPVEPLPEEDWAHAALVSEIPITADIRIFVHFVMTHLSFRPHLGPWEGLGRHICL